MNVCFYIYICYFCTCMSMSIYICSDPYKCIAYSFIHTCIYEYTNQYIGDTFTTGYVERFPNSKFPAACDTLANGKQV